MPRNIGGYVGVSTQPVESKGILRGIYNAFDYSYFKRLGKIPRVQNTVPTGTLVLFVGTSNPDSDRFVLANGSAISRTTYSELYGVIGTAFGTGDGATTFDLPDLDDHIISHEPTNIGISTAGTVTTPLHDHGTIQQMGNIASGGVVTDYNSNLPNLSNNATTNATGGTTKFRDHQVLPLISIQDTYLPAGSILYTFRDTSLSRATGKCVVCDGSSISASQNGQLFTLVGNNFGGNPISFAVPNLTGCHPKCNKTYAGSNNYSTDNHPSHVHGPITGPANYNLGGRFSNGSNQRLTTTGTTSSNSSVGNGNETRADNFAAHPVVCTELTELAEGDLIIYLGASAPTKTTSLNGGTLDKNTYANLSAALESDFTQGSNIEILDCRNKYLRGTDLGSGRDTDAANRTFGGTANNTGANICGTFQDQSYKSHTHTFTTSSGANLDNGGGNQFTHYYINAGSNVDTANLTITYNDATVSTNSKINTKRVRTNICMYVGS